jgi:hypothetical protein
MVSSSGPLVALSVLTAAGECSEKFAAAASNRGLPGAGMAHFSWRAFDRGGGVVLAEQLLGDQPAERVADHHRQTRQSGDDLGVVPGDVVDAVAGDAVWVGPGIRDRGAVTGPAGCDRLIAPGFEQLDPRIPGAGVQRPGVTGFHPRVKGR